MRMYVRGTRKFVDGVWKISATTHRGPVISLEGQSWMGNSVEKRFVVCVRGCQVLSTEIGNSENEKWIEEMEKAHPSLEYVGICGAMICVGLDVDMDRRMSV